MVALNPCVVSAVHLKLLAVSFPFVKSGLYSIYRLTLSAARKDNRRNPEIKRKDVCKIATEMTNGQPRHLLRVD